MERFLITTQLLHSIRGDLLELIQSLEFIQERGLPFESIQVVIDCLVALREMLGEEYDRLVDGQYHQNQNWLRHIPYIFVSEWLQPAILILLVRVFIFIRYFAHRSHSDNCHCPVDCPRPDNFGKKTIPKHLFSAIWRLFAILYSERLCLCLPTITSNSHFCQNFERSLLVQMWLSKIKTIFDKCL